MGCQTIVSVLFIGTLSLITAAAGELCPSPTSPSNGRVRCSKDGIFLTCVGTCNTGYKFETGQPSVTTVCNELAPKTSKTLPFPGCIQSNCWSSLASAVNTSRITASSVWTGVQGYYFGPERARLSSGVENVDGVVQSGGWRSSINTLDQFIQVELADVKRIMGVVTKGRSVPSGDSAREYVTRYRVLYSTDGSHWQPYSTRTVTDQFLDGNTDSISLKTNMFVCPFNAKYIRINPLAWHENIAMRFDFLGCDSDGTDPVCSTATTPIPAPIRTTLAPTVLVPTPPLDMCSSIPPPQNGATNCEIMGDRLVCVANCMDGYVFETKELLVKRVCLRTTGVWPSTATLPRCIYNTQLTPPPPSSNFTSGCVTQQKECDTIGNGDFQACGGCHFFATCSEGYLYVRACPENLLFDEVSKVCDYHSRSCPGA